MNSYPVLQGELSLPRDKLFLTDINETLIQPSCVDLGLTAFRDAGLIDQKHFEDISTAKTRSAALKLLAEGFYLRDARFVDIAYVTLELVKSEKWESYKDSKRLIKLSKSYGYEGAGLTGLPQPIAGIVGRDQGLDAVYGSRFGWREKAQRNNEFPAEDDLKKYSELNDFYGIDFNWNKGCTTGKVLADMTKNPSKNNSVLELFRGCPKRPSITYGNRNEDPLIIEYPPSTPEEERQQFDISIVASTDKTDKELISKAEKNGWQIWNPEEDNLVKKARQLLKSYNVKPSKLYKNYHMDFYPA